VITDPQGRIDYVNPGLEQITGYASAEVIARIRESEQQGKSQEEAPSCGAPSLAAP
jgi:PAS domain S-box-containing protein